MFLLPSEKGSTLKGKNLLPLGALSFKSRPHLRRGLVCRKTVRVLQKLSPLSEWWKMYQAYATALNISKMCISKVNRSPAEPGYSLTLQTE